MGSRGYYVMEQLYKGSGALAQVVAVCDTYTGNLARAKDRVQTMGKNTPKAYEDYRDLLPRFYRPFPFDRQKEHFAGENPIFSAPMLFIARQI